MLYSISLRYLEKYVILILTMSEIERRKPNFVRVNEHQKEMVQEVVEYQGVRKFLEIGDHVMRRSDIALNGHLMRMLITMESATTFEDGVKTGFGIMSVDKSLAISKDVMEAHLDEFEAYRQPDESRQAAVTRLGMAVLDSDPNMVDCLEYLSPRFGYADNFMFATGAGYGEYLLELARREDIDSTSAQMLEAEYGGLFSDDIWQQ